MQVNPYLIKVDSVIATTFEALFSQTIAFALTTLRKSGHGVNDL